MKTALWVFAFSALGLLPVKSSEREIPYFVSTQWLADHANDSDLVILQTAFTRKEYEVAHIPGTRFLWFRWLAIDTPDLSTEMPDISSAKNILEELGISRNSKIVIVFTKGSVTSTTRMLLALSYFGFGNQTAVLDGGLDAWKAEGRPISKETPVVKRTSLTLSLHPEIITNAEWVKSRLHSDRVKIIDARSKNFYDGNGGGVLRTGHIRGAKNLPFTSIVDSTNRVLPVPALKKLFDAAGVIPGDTVVTYCHIGQQATLVYTAARLLGFEAIVYDGCFEDWNVRDDDYPVEKAEEKK